MRRLLTFTLALLAAMPALAANDTIRRGFNVAEGGTLRLHAGIGNITIVSGGTGVAIEIVREADGSDGEELMREHKIDIRQNGNDVTIDGPLNRGNGFSWFNSNDYEVKWNIRVPARYNIDVRTSGGSIDLANIGGTVEARTSGGNIKTGRLAGISNLKTSGGSIRVGGANASLVAHTSGGSIEIADVNGKVEAKTSGGGIRLRRVAGPVLAKTSGGSIDIQEAAGAIEATTSGGSITAALTSQPRTDSKLSTSGGSVTVSIANGIGVELDARASGGGVSTSVPVTVVGSQDQNEVQGRIGNGGPKLVLRTSGGGIRVNPMS